MTVTGIYQFAGIPMRLTTLNALTHEMCQDYRCALPPAFELETTAGDIDRERCCEARTSAPAGEHNATPSDAYLETLAIYRKMCEVLPSHGAFLIHGSALAVDGKAYLLAAPSGTGKSTQAALWRRAFGKRVTMLNDDKPLIKVTDSEVLACGTPWDGQHHLSSNAMAPLRGVCLIQRSSTNSIVSLTVRDAYTRMLRQVYRPANPASLERTLALLDHTLEKVGIWELSCNTRLDAAELAYAAMEGGARP